MFISKESTGSFTKSETEPVCIRLLLKWWMGLLLALCTEINFILNVQAPRSSCICSGCWKCFVQTEHGQNITPGISIVTQINRPLAYFSSGSYVTSPRFTLPTSQGCWEAYVINTSTDCLSNLCIYHRSNVLLTVVYGSTLPVKTNG